MPLNEAKQSDPPSSPVQDLRPQLKLAEPPQARPETPVPAPAAPAARRRRGRSPYRKLLTGATLIAALAGAGWYGVNWYTTGRFIISTDDAYIRADTSALSAKVSGYVADIPLAENTLVSAGTTILKLDDGDFRLAVASAKDRITLQRATVARIARQAEAQQAAIDSARAKVAMAAADAENYASILERQKALAKKNFASTQAVDQARANSDRAAAGVTSAKADLAAAEADYQVIQAEAQEARATLAQLNTELARAERDLSFTEIKAPFDGIIANRAVEPGQFVQTGQRLMALVPVATAYVEANLKETQLAEVHPGQKAEISVDAWNGATISGTVESISPASGAEFSLLPPENATGNFTKITQRVPVRIRLDSHDAARLRAGLSVVVDIDTRESKGSATAALE
ncbi:MAG: HlyD family secretion protein [Rhizobiales bacterium]|nr:HlyD family secretion protein [Hyphomicrobiales bacterium]